MGREHDRHHLFWTREQYSTRLERKFRTHHGFIIPTLIEAHRDLHANLGPPPKPNHYQMAAVIDQVDQHDITPVHTTVELFEEWASREGRIAENAADIAKHLLSQTDYLWGQHAKS